MSDTTQKEELLNLDAALPKDVLLKDYFSTFARHTCIRLRQNLLHISWELNMSNLLSRDGQKQPIEY